ncbi:Pr6Pr family membrane protein [Microbacterium sp. SMR1]|uniref:Pr6Pr family membrane protein n=1 Tax=Microbacterium sp. SMR1 TaxID=1497340 RepID=UPI00215C506B|nr:Pr6Pr family membrane protein [Microbacterium sp. SMR1]
MQSSRQATVWSLLRLAMAVVILAAVSTQLTVSLTRTAESGGDVATVFANFFSFFTILSNVIAAVVLATVGVRALIGRAGPESSLGLSAALTCATAYMVITGVVYNALLRGITLPQGSEPVPWSNEVLHLIGPIFLVLDLLIGARRRALRWQVVWVVVAFPLLWVAYTLVRGPLVTNPTTGEPYWYPYPFLNPNGPGGWGSVAAYVVVIAIGFVAVGFGAVWVTRRRARVLPTEVTAAG